MIMSIQKDDMTEKSTKTTTQVKVDKELYYEFKKQAYLEGQTIPEALECAIKLYNEKAKAE